MGIDCGLVSLAKHASDAYVRVQVTITQHARVICFSFVAESTFVLPTTPGHHRLGLSGWMESAARLDGFGTPAVFSRVFVV